MACFFMGAAAFWLACGRLLDFELAGLLTVGLAVQPCWSDVVPKGQSELFAILGVAVFLLGVTALVGPSGLALEDARTLPKRRLLPAAACIGFGGIVAVGSKEDFTGLVVVAVLGLFVLGIIRDQPRPLMMAYALVLCCGGVVIHGIYVGVLEKGVDLYGTSIVGRRAVLLQSLWTKSSSAAIVLLAALSVLSLVGRGSGGKLRVKMHTAWTTMAVQAYFVFAAVFLHVFYHGDVPLATRYQVPYALIPVLSVALCYSAVTKGELVGVLSRRSARLVKLAAGSLIVLLISVSGIGFNREYAARYAQATLDLRSRLVRVEDALRSDPKAALVFESYGFNDFEALVAVDTYLRSAGIANPFYLEIVGYSEATAKADSERYLSWLTLGLVGRGRRFLPYSELPDSTSRKLITFSKPDSIPAAIANFWPLL